MNMGDISTLIGSVGFPIVCCCFMGYYINSTMKDFTKTMENNTLALKELVTSLSKKNRGE